MYIVKDHKVTTNKLEENVMELTISKTIQVKQFEPITVTVTEKAEINSNQDYEKLKSVVGACVEDTLVTEIQRYNKHQ